MLNYVLVTPAFNEETHLEKTIQSVLAQKRAPDRWIIVNDGSRDKTGEIADRYAATNSFIQTLTIPRTGTHSFGSKARAFNAGIQLLCDAQYDLIGNLDADISVNPDYFENLIQAFEKDANLGITGGSVYTTVAGEHRCYDKTIDSVGGAVQLFRRKCFEELGGYMPLPYGGIDAAAEIIAKMNGWTVRKSLSDHAYECRTTGTAAATPLAASYRLGKRFHSLGYGTFYFFLFCLYRVCNRPFSFGSSVAFFGYLDSVVNRRPIALPPHVVQYLRRQQRRKIRNNFMFWRSMRSAKSDPR